MDLFDTTAYFSSKVPVIAAVRPLLKSAVCALSAKHLQHLYHISDGIDRNSYILSLADEETWHYQSAKHYDQALGYLKTAIDLENYNDSPSDKEEMLAAVAILCLYELMDAPGTAWRAHLSALPLFNDTSASMPAHSSVIIPRTAIKGPIFWSLARQDLLCACMLETAGHYSEQDADSTSYKRNIDPSRSKRHASLAKCRPSHKRARNPVTFHRNKPIGYPKLPRN
jgi:hypothetical protein